MPHVKTQLMSMDEHIKSLSDDAARQTMKGRRSDLSKRLKEVQTALKHVGNELDTESEVQKMRILGMSVDSRMLEGFIGLFTATIFTLYQIFQS